MKKGDLERAIELYTGGIEANDEYKGRNLYGRAYCHKKLHEFELAKADANAVLEMKSQNPTWLNSYAYWLKANTAYIQGDPKSEIVFYRAALGYLPTNLKLMNAMGLALIEQGKYLEGIEMLDQVIQQDEMYSFALNNRALGSVMIGDYESALLDLKRSFDLDKENPYLYKGLFWYYYMVGSEQIACDLLQTAMEKDMKEYGNFKDTEELEQLFASHCTSTR